MNNAPSARPFLSPICHIEPGLEADPLVIRLAFLTDQHLNRGLVRIGSRANLCLPSKPIRPGNPRQRLAATADAELRAEHGGTTVAELDELARHQNSTVRGYVALNPKTAAATLLHLAGDPLAAIRRTASRHPNLPVDEQTLLFAEPAFHVALAGNPALDLSLLVHLAQSEDEEVRAAVAYNGATPPDLLDRLAGAPELSIRLAAASNLNTPKAALARLTLAAEADVRERVGRNHLAEQADYVPLPNNEPELLGYSLFGGEYDAYVDVATSTAYFVRDRLETLEQAVALFLWIKYGEGEE